MAEKKRDRKPHNTQTIHTKRVNKKPQSKDLTTLREKAEKKLKEQTKRLDTLSKQDVERLVHELGTHQIELEMQNEELRMAQENLEVSRSRYSELYDFAPVGYFTFDTDGLLQEVNLTGAHLLGIDRRMLINKPFSVFIADAESRNIFHAHLVEVLRKQIRQTCEIRLKSKTGPVFYAQLQSIAVDDCKGNIIGCRTTVIDITERKQADEALRRSEEKFSKVFRCSPERMAITTLKEGRYVDVNEEFLHFSGFSREEVIGRTSQELKVWIDPSERDEVVKRLCEKGEVNNYETRFRNKDGEIRTVLWSAEVIDYGGEQLILALTRDITERKQAEEALQMEMTSLKYRLLTDQLLHEEAFSSIVTRSKQMRAIFQYVEVIAMSNQHVLITGETGVGKELIAKAIHTVSGRNGDFIAVNVAGLDDMMFSDTLFGHRKGAYTGADQSREGLIARASGGTLFLDEISDLHESSQVKLLRLLQERTYYPLGSDVPQETDARIVVATNQNIQDLISQGRFRKDLYYRLWAYQIRIPPLRERKEDIPLLLYYFLDEAATSLKKKRPTPTPELMQLLTIYDFPGNIRELRAMIYDALAHHESGNLTMESFREFIKMDEVGVSSIHPSPGDGDALVRIFGHFPNLKEVEEFIIVEALERANRNQGTAALLLGMTRQALNRRLHRSPELQKYFML